MKILYTLIACLFVLNARADVILPALLTNNMVLQQQENVRIWGWASPSEKVTVTGSWDNQPVIATTTDNATWALSVRTPVAGGPYSLTITGRNTIILTDVLIGEVWVCAGQSNMEWSANNGVKDARAELPTANNANIRLFKMPKLTAETPQSDTKGHWEVCDSVTLKRFSAVGYFFGKKLQKDLNVPIGLIDVAWGGSYIDSWIPTPAIQLYPDTRTSATKMTYSAGWPSKPGYIFNAMVAPMTNYNMAGVIWYQGESNRHYPQAYYHLTHLLVDTWRGLWQKDFPFYYVQIAPFTYNGKHQTAAVRDAQSKAMDIPKSGMIVTTDLVDNLKDIHPAYKREVGNRLANWALAETYGKPATGYKSPQYQSMQIIGNSIRLSFANAPNGLITKGSDLTEFTIAGPDQVFVSAKARIKGNTIEVWADEVKSPVAVRFAYRDAPEPTVFSKEGLPVIPFRTDDWELGLTP